MTNPHPSKNKSFFERFKPGLFALICLVIILPASLISIVSGNIIYTGGSSADSTNASRIADSDIRWDIDPVIHNGQIDADSISKDQDLNLVNVNDYCTFEFIRPFMDGNTLYTPLKVTKNTLCDSITDYMTVSVLDAQTDEFLDSCRMHFNFSIGYDTVWITPAFFDIEPKIANIDTVKFSISADPALLFPASEYSFLSEKKDPSDQELYAGYLEVNEPYTKEITILDTGDGTPEHPLQFSIDMPNTPEPNTTINGCVNVIYSRNGNIVYAEVCDYEGELEDTTAYFEFALDNKIPDFDTVEIIHTSD